MLYISSFTDRSFPKGSFLCLPEPEISENIKLIGSIDIKWTLLLELLYKLLCPCKIPHKYRVFNHCVVSLSKNINPSLVLVQPRKICPFITERLLMGRKESNQTEYSKWALLKGERMDGFVSPWSAGRKRKLGKTGSELSTWQWHHKWCHHWQGKKIN